MQRMGRTKKINVFKLFADVLSAGIFAVTILVVARFVIIPGRELRYCKELIASKQWSEAIDYINTANNTECDELLSVCYFNLANDKFAMQDYGTALQYAELVDTAQGKELAQECKRHINADYEYQKALEGSVRYSLNAESNEEDRLATCENELRYLEPFCQADFYDGQLAELAEEYYNILCEEYAALSGDGGIDDNSFQDIAYRRIVVIAEMVHECGFFASEKETADYFVNRAELLPLLREAQHDIEDWLALTELYQMVASSNNVTRSFIARTSTWDTTIVEGISFIASAQADFNSAPVDRVWSAGIKGKGVGSAKRYTVLPYPVRVPSLGGSCSEASMYVGNTEFLIANGAATGASYRIINPDGGATITTTAWLSAMGTIATPPQTPTIEYNNNGAAQAIAIAQSYVDAQKSGRQFKYGKNFFYYGVDTINDENGAAMMECDTFIGMVLRGIPYERSPFANLTPDYMFSYSNMMLETNPNGFAWCDRLIQNITDGTYLHHDAKYAADYALMCWGIEGSIFSDAEYAQTGDLVFWKRPEQSNFFDNISHVAILSIEDGVRYVYEVTGQKESNGRIVQKVKLEEKNTPAYFGRIDYSGN